MFIRKSEYKDMKAKIDYLNGRCELLRSLLQIETNSTARYRHLFTWQVFQRIEELMSAFTTTGNQDYAQGFSNALQQVEDRIRALKNEMLGVDNNGNLPHF